MAMMHDAYPAAGTACASPFGMHALFLKAATGVRGLVVALPWTLAIAAHSPTPAFATGPVATLVAPPGAVAITPDMLIQSVVDANPAGTTYFLAAGVYRLQSVVPKDGDRYLGAVGARLNGSRALTGAASMGSLWAFDGQAPDPATLIRGVCMPAFPRCNVPNALFMDGHPLRAVASLSDVVPGTWYFDYGAHRVYLADAPAGRTVELSVVPFAFGGAARNVLIQNLVVEKYAAADQQGAVNDQGAGAGWTIRDNEVSQNYGYGITMGSGNVASGNFVHDNGELGIGGGNSSDILVERNDISRNAWNGTDCNWECGGAKWGAVTGLVVRANDVHDNGGDGLWTDEGSSSVVYTGNLIQNNALAGISHEISSTAEIVGNVIRYNGALTFVWGWHAQIQVQNSSNTQVRNNLVELDPVRGGNGIVLIQQDRGPGSAVTDVVVHDNEIVMRGGIGTIAGWFADFAANEFTAGGNNFDSNHYVVAPLMLASELWSVNGSSTFQAWQANGADPAGLVTTNLPP